MRTRIFTFWEPRGRVPGYIQACMRTWTRYIPESELVLLDFASIGDWLPADEIEAVTCRGLSLPKQADCYRALLLNRHGGIWLDADTIVTPAVVRSGVLGGDCKSEVVMFGRRPSADGSVKDVTVHGACIVAKKPHAALMADWASQLPGRVARFRRYAANPFLRAFSRKTWRKCRAYDYCLNAILNPLVLTAGAEQLRLLDRDALGAFPEHGEQSGLAPAEAYRDYYFRSGDVGRAIACGGGIIMLHNSWTPEEFRRMDEKSFLASDVRLALLLRRLLENERHV